jgi:hypothetical protein
MSPTVEEKAKAHESVREHLRFQLRGSKKDVVPPKAEPAPSTPEPKLGDQPPAPAPESKVEPPKIPPSPPKDDEPAPVPYARFKEVNEKAKALEDERRRVQEELDLLRAENAKTRKDHLLEDLLSEKSRPEGFDEWSIDRQQAWVANRAVERAMTDEFGALKSDIHEMLRLHKTQKSFGHGYTMEQYEALSEVVRRAPDLAASEQLAVAKMRFPELFGAKENGIPPSHSVNVPSSTTESAPPPPPRDDKGQFIERMKATGDKGVQYREAMLEIKRRLFGKKR